MTRLAMMINQLVILKINQIDTIQSTDSTKSNSLDLSTYDDATHAHNDIDIEIYIVTEDVTHHIPLPKCKRTATETPTTICTAKTIGSVRSHKIYYVSF